MRRIATATSIAILVLAASLPSGALAASDLPQTGVDFAPYQLVPLALDRPAYAGPATPHSLDGVARARQVSRELDPAALATLLRQGFVVVPGEDARFHMAYESQRYQGVPVFVTTDAAYDAFHLIFDKLLRDIEQKELSPRLGTLLTGMLEQARAQETELAGSDLAEAAAKVTDIISVAGALLGLDVGKLSPEAQAEQALIEAHEGNAKSPILGTYIDYSLYTPRGHYTRTPKLSRYFKAMSVLGQTAFLLPGSKQVDDSVVQDPASLRTAVLAARTLVGHPDLEKLWHEIYEPTSFLVGVGDDYTPFELAAAVESAVPGGMAAPSTATDDASLAAIAAALRDTREVRIDSERPSVRLMGTRFVIDSWIMDQLIWPNVGIETDKRKFASPLDLAAAFGSGLALGIQDAAGETHYLHYPEQMEAMTAAVAARPDEAWGRTVYDAWLAAIDPMWHPHTDAYPDFMRTEAWDTKDQQTGFGSYAELRHDTILYVKQFVGELGDAGPPPAPVRNWAEPEPVAFGRLAAAATLMRDGLAQRDLLTKESKGLLDDYIDMVTRLGRLALEELDRTPLKNDDNEWLKTIGGLLESLWWRSSDAKKGAAPLSDDMSAIIADIGSSEGKSLEIGTGFVDTIYVLVPDDQGRFQVATGGVYSYYEFLQPSSDRLTDEAWRSMLNDGKAPDRPAWQETLFR